jgi:asparagine synthase (glutamine-hydrolysing)
MCGIAGFTHHTRSVGDSVIRRMASALTHRGPDQQGSYISSRLSLGAVRLQIFDLQRGEQPLRSDDCKTVIAYNGEIYNFREIRAELEQKGHVFRSDCDTEVALKAFLQWDTACFGRFRGMFAMAIWSERENRLVLARDRMGIKPLYIRRTGADIIFGSELKALFAHPAVTRQLDTEALQDFLSLNYVPAPRTLVRGIEKLPSGHYLEWRNGVEKLTCWWNPEFAPDAAMHPEAAAEELDHLLRESVREHLASDVPVGIWASGGVDSSALIHYAAELGCRPLNTFSVAFRNQSCDERRWFRDIASRYGTVHREVELSGESELTAAIEEMAWFSDEPGADAGALPVWFLSKLSRQHVTVALSGEGGDELFGGYMTYRADDMARPLRRVPRFLRRGALSVAEAFLPPSNAKIGFEYKLKRWLEGSLLPPDDAHTFWNGAFSGKQQRRILRNCGGPLPGRLCHGLPDARDIGFLNRYLMLDQRYYLQDNLLYKVDRMSMAHSLEVRPPFLDHRIVEFAARLPEKLKLNGSRQKIVLKQALRGKLPDSVLNRKKSGLDIPAHEWFRGPLLPMLQDTLTFEAVRNSNLFHPNETLSLIGDHKEKRINAGFQLWGLMTLFLWLKRWNIEVPPTREEANPDRPLYAAAS